MSEATSAVIGGGVHKILMDYGIQTSKTSANYLVPSLTTATATATSTSAVLLKRAYAPRVSLISPDGARATTTITPPAVHHTSECDDDDESGKPWEEDDFIPVTNTGKQKTPNVIRGEFQRYLDEQNTTNKTGQIISCISGF
jgi:hypothetical protein